MIYGEAFREDGPQISASEMWRRWRPTYLIATHSRPNRSCGEFETGNVGNAQPTWRKQIEHCETWLAELAMSGRVQKIMEQECGVYLRERGCMSRDDLRGLSLILKSTGRLAKRLAQHNKRALENGWHLYATPWSIRSSRNVCGARGYMMCDPRGLDKACSGCAQGDARRKQFNACMDSLNRLELECMEAAHLVTML